MVDFSNGKEKKRALKKTKKQKRTRREEAVSAREEIPWRAVCLCLFCLRIYFRLFFVFCFFRVVFPSGRMRLETVTPLAAFVN